MQFIEPQDIDPEDQISNSLSGLVGDLIFVLIVHAAMAALMTLFIASIWLLSTEILRGKAKDVFLYLGTISYSTACLYWWHLESPRTFAKTFTHVALLGIFIGCIVALRDRRRRPTVSHKTRVD